MTKKASSIKGSLLVLKIPTKRDKKLLSPEILPFPTSRSSPNLFGSKNDLDTSNEHIKNSNDKIEEPALERVESDSGGPKKLRIKKFGENMKKALKGPIEKLKSPITLETIRGFAATLKDNTQVKKSEDTSKAPDVVMEDTNTEVKETIAPVVPVESPPDDNVCLIPPTMQYARLFSLCPNRQLLMKG
jgi:hypothetical protein